MDDSGSNSQDGRGVGGLSLITYPVVFNAPPGALKGFNMKSIILAALAALSIAFAGFAAAGGVQDFNGGFPEGSIQTSAD